jgi:DinB superfamily
MTEIDLLLTQIDQAYNRRSWHGTNLRGSVRGMTPEDAVWRPDSRGHNAQEIVIHAAYWKYVVWRRLTGATRGSFPLGGSDWFARPGADARIWRADLRLLDDCHRQLRETIEGLAPKRLHRAAGGSTTALALVTGIIAHDLYHAGQIQLLKRMRTRS